MKKSLLLLVSGVLLSFGAFAAEPEDITPANYNWESGTCLLNTWTKGANFAAPVLPTLKTALGGVDYDGNGLVGFAGAAAWGGSIDNLSAGLQVVDLGGQVGKVLAFVGKNSKADSILNIPSLTKCTGMPGWFNINFFGDQNRTPKGGGLADTASHHIRVRIVMQIVANKLSESDQVVAKAYPVNNDGGMNPQGTNEAEGAPISSGEFLLLDEDGEPITDENENLIFDPNRWLVYEFDTWCPADDGDKTFAPLRIKIEMNNGAIANSAILFKEVKFFKDTDQTKVIENNAHTHSYIYLEKGSSEDPLHIDYESFTPANYNWENGTCVLNAWNKTANFAVPVLSTLKNYLGGVDYDGNGLVGFSGAAAWTGAISDLTSGCQIVDLGGKVGKVFAFVGKNSKADSILNIPNLGKCTNMPGWFNINFFGDQNRTPKGGALDSTAKSHIRIRLVMQIVPNKLSESDQVVAKAYPVNNDGAMNPQGTSEAEGTSISSGEFCLLDEEGDPVQDEEENLVFDPDRWLIYEMDTYCPADEAEKSFAPHRIKIEMNNGAIANSAILFKEVGFYIVDDQTDVIPGNVHKHTLIKLTKGNSPKIVGLEEVLREENREDGIIYNILGIRVNDMSAPGLYILNGKKYLVK